MRKFKITFFNPETLKKSVTRFIFQWDYNNHCWDVTTISIHGESTRTYTGNPMDLIEHFKDCCIRKNEYATIKSFA